MTHPFEKMLMTALSKSTLENNQVSLEAERIREKGYQPAEIYAILVSLSKGLIDQTEAEIVKEAAEDFSVHVDLDD